MEKLSKLLLLLTFAITIITIAACGRPEEASIILQTMGNVREVQGETVDLEVLCLPGTNCTGELQLGATLSTGDSGNFTFDWQETAPTYLEINTGIMGIMGIANININSPTIPTEGSHRLNVDEAGGASTYVDIHINVTTNQGLDTLADIFESAELARFIARELNVGINDEIDLSRLETITQLEIATGRIGNNAYVDSLNGIEHLTHLTRLGLLNNQIRNLTPLSSLSRLQVLYFYGGRVEDLAPLSSLTSLRALSFVDAAVGNNLSPLSTLTNLEFLELFEPDGTSISSTPLNLSPLSNLTNLEYLILFSSQISDLRPLGSLNLSELVVSTIVQLPPTNVGTPTQLELFLPNGDAIANLTEDNEGLSADHGVFMYNNQNLTWQTAGNNAALWDSDIFNNNGEWIGMFFGGVLQTVNGGLLAEADQSVIDSEAALRSAIARRIWDEYLLSSSSSWINTFRSVRESDEFSQIRSCVINNADECFEDN